MGSTVSRVNNSYNKFGFKTEEIYYGEGNKFRGRTENIYDDYNCLVKVSRYDTSNIQYLYYTKEYNNNNQEICYTEYDAKGEIRIKENYEYSKEGEIIKEARTGKAGTEIKNFKVISINKKTNNNFTLLESYNCQLEDYPSGKLKNITYANDNEEVTLTYDENERLIERKVKNKGVWYETFTWKYREDGALLEESESTSKYIGKSYYKTSIYYTVDSNGNWIEKYKLDSEGRVLDLSVREIDYF